MLTFPEADWICVVGVSAELYEQYLPSLSEDNKKRLIFLDPEGGATCFQHPQVAVFPARSSQEVLQAAKKIGWKSVFHTAAVVDLVKSPELAAQFEQALIKHKEAAHLLLSDWADVGESVIKRAFAHWNSLPDVRSALSLKDRFQQIPAIICGGGPSLKKNIHHVDPDKALIFAGGAALNQLPIEPHFAASIDRDASPAFFHRQPFWQIPFFYQSRMNPKNFSSLHGEKLYVPDGCYPAESWLSGSELFDGGWTVGTFLTSLAVLLGCDPIIYVGMDLCYEETQKYAFCEAPASSEKLVETLNRFGQKVSSQRDWLMAADWMAKLASQRWDKTFVNATEGGLRLQGPIKEASLQEVLGSLPIQPDLSGRVHAEIMTLDWMSIPLERMNEWKKSMKRCLSLCKKGLKHREPISWDREIVYQTLLFPLWQIWGPLFERELEVDSQPMSLEEKLRLNQILFFQRVLHEQAN
ncbi:MAG TPA: hypothetical protein DCE71_01575 [Parachlamydiales bacterium]|nr:hypothetical protein [Parachlamydiales bacterium]